MRWMRVRITLAVVGLAMLLLGLVPIALWVVVIQGSGATRWFVAIAALLLSPLLLFLRFGPYLLLAAWKAKPVTIMGRRWAEQAPSEDVIDAAFEEQP